MLNFYQWLKHVPALLAKKISATTPSIFCTFSAEPLVIYVVCLRTDTINSVDACNINHIMTTPPNVTANGTYYIEQVNCNEGTHELVYVALTLFITSLSALLLRIFMK